MQNAFPSRPIQFLSPRFAAAAVQGGFKVAMAVYHFD
jgi:hypothetical protein